MGAGLITLLSATAGQAGNCNDFSGFHVGTHLGNGNVKSELKNDRTHQKADVAMSGFIGGLNVGYAKQFPNRFYMGVEAYGHLANQNGKANDTKMERKDGFGMKMRPGFVIGNALLYGSLGVESSKFKHGDQTKRHTGFVPGVGIAFNATDHIVIGIEATHGLYGSAKSKDNNGTAAKPTTTDVFTRIGYKW